MDTTSPELTDKAKEHLRAVLATLTLAAYDMSPDAFAALLHHLGEGIDDVLFEILKGKPALEEISKVVAAFKL